MKTVLPNYNECITNLSNSILKHYKLKTYHNTLSYIDKILDKDYKNVIVILCDGMGSKILDEVLDSKSFLVKNRIKEITSVFPPTTTAATTSFLSALNPNEHGWLGWDLYFRKENQTITMFLNTLKDSNIVAQDYNVANKTFPYESIIKKINDVENFSAYSILSFKDEKYLDFENVKNDIIELTQKEGKKFIYAYYENPDSLLHEFGIDNKLVKENIKNINKNIEDLCNKVKDSIVFVIADHGHIDTNYYNLDDYVEIKNMLERTTSLEPRVVSFKVKKEYRKVFKETFNNYFKNDFIIYTAKEIIDNKIFGEGNNNKLFNESIGDFIAIAINKKSIIYSDKTIKFKSMHAGLTEREMLIPIIVKEIK